MSSPLLLVALVLSDAAIGGTCLLGFSKDSSTLIVFHEADPDFETGSSRVRLLDLRSGKANELTDVASSEGCDAAKVDSPSFRAWRRKNGFVPAKASRVSPDRKATAEVVATETSTAGTWSGATWKAESAAGWRLSVTRDGVTRKAAVTAGGAPTTVFWTPDGKRTVWVVRHEGHSMRDRGYEELVVGTDGAPSVAVLAPKAKQAEGLSTLQRLAGAGLTPMGLSEPRKERPATTVFSSAGQEAWATKAAALFPNAKVEAMTWSSPFDVVVVLGAEK